jgi:hypothetical protein
MSRDSCDNCGSETFGEGHFAVGKLWCSACWSGRKPPVAMPPTEKGKRAIASWIAPRPPRQLGLNLAQATQREGANG